MVPALIRATGKKSEMGGVGHGGKMCAGGMKLDGRDIRDRLINHVGESGMPVPRIYGQHPLNSAKGHPDDGVTKACRPSRATHELRYFAYLGGVGRRNSHIISIK